MTVLVNHKNKNRRKNFYNKKNPITTVYEKIIIKSELICTSSTILRIENIVPRGIL